MSSSSYSLTGKTSDSKASVFMTERFGGEKPEFQNFADELGDIGIKYLFTELPERKMNR